MWLASSIWSTAPLNPENSKIIVDLINKGAVDVEYVSNQDQFYNRMATIKDEIATTFVKEHGHKAVPVTNQEESQRASDAGLKPVIVPESQKKAIESSTVTKVKLEPVKTTEELVGEWLSRHKQSLSKKAIKELEHIVGIKDNGEGLPF
ncbi:hypothetical protein D3C79_835840 [compost metagenome]